MQNIGSKILQKDELVKLIQEENFVGYIYKIDYDTAQVMTNDLWKKKVLGIPHNCFLVAAEFDPNNLKGNSLSVIKRVADEGGIKIGQIIYDINGDYANANKIDKGALADIYPNETVRYRMLKTEGFEDLGNNFYEQLNEGFSIITRELEDAKRINSDYVRAFVNISFDEPDKREIGEHNRWEVRVAAYKVLLYKAGFEPPSKDYKVKFTVSKKIRDIVKLILKIGLLPILIMKEKSKN